MLEGTEGRLNHTVVNNARDALAHHLENAGMARAEAFLITQAIERFITAKMEDKL